MSKVSQLTTKLNAISENVSFLLRACVQNEVTGIHKFYRREIFLIGTFYVSFSYELRGHKSLNWLKLQGSAKPEVTLVFAFDRCAFAIIPNPHQRSAVRSSPTTFHSDDVITQGMGLFDTKSYISGPYYFSLSKASQECSFRWFAAQQYGDKNKLKWWNKFQCFLQFARVSRVSIKPPGTRQFKFASKTAFLRCLWVGNLCRS